MINNLNKVLIAVALLLLIVTGYCIGHETGMDEGLHYNIKCSIYQHD